jgi:hypothetical protein
MTQKTKTIVLDANILIRAVLGIRTFSLMINIMSRLVIKFRLKN